jgi:peptidylprolyl isomerase
MTAIFARAGRLAGILALVLALVAGAGTAFAQQGKPHLLITLSSGVVDIELLPDVAPLHVERIVTLAGEGFYDGVPFHRVIQGFMAQTGDPTGTGTGGSQLPDLKAEFSAEPFLRGTVGAARTNNPNSANSQFFIVTGDARHLDRGYSLFGRVVAGMELVDAIKTGAPGSGMVRDPDRMVSAKIEYRN